MKKELNPELFSKNVSGAVYSGVDAQFLNTDKQIFELRKATENINDEIDKMAQHTAQSVQSLQLKIDRIMANLARLEQNHNGLASEIGFRLQGFQSKIQEQTSIELKTQEMMDRYHGILKSYETRVSQLQKIIAEKDAQILATQTTLNEAKMEIARMKRL